jgi:hypothetical protein
LKVKHFPSKYGGSKIQEYFPNVLVRISIRQRDMVKDFYNSCFAVRFDLSIYP